MKTIELSSLDDKAKEKVEKIWNEKNHAAIARKRGKGFEIVEVDEGNDDITSYQGAKVIKKK